MSNELVTIVTNEQGQKLVSGRELHSVLEIGRDFTTWIKRMIVYGFEENVDYTVFTQTGVNPKGGRPQVDYILTLDMAKHIAMVQRTEIGMRVRNYFLECEKQVIEVKRDSYMIEDPIKRAERWIEEQKERKQLMIENQKLEEEVIHKDDIINGLTQNVTLADQRQRINRVIRHGAKGRYAERYALLYKEFEDKYHVSLTKRMKRDIENGVCRKSINRMDYICDVMNMTDELYQLLAKVFGSEFKDLMGYMHDLL